ncbi:MAG TPA: hypothetical protein PLH52_02570 [Paludibacteraceae bacterium]|nr:hypothetical protein [Paludibacteraceae bacterium]
MKTKIILTVMLILAVAASAKKKPETFSNYVYGKNDQCTVLSLKFEKGKEHNHPLYAVWLADENGKYIQTLYVSKSVAKGYFERGNRNTGKWLPGEIQRPATLPYWAHQRGVKNELGTYMPTPKNPVPDAYSGATPLSSFVLTMKTETRLKGKYRIYLELNQSWDWNEYWTNNKYPEDKEYKTSSQPAVVYSADFDTNKAGEEIELKPVGRSHYAGSDGQLYTDLNTLTTALKIAKKITMTFN